MPTTEGWDGGRRGSIEGETGLQVGPGGHEVATKERHGALGRLALQHEVRITLVVCQVGELLGQRASGGQLGLGFMKAIEAVEHAEAQRCLAQLVAELVRPGVDFARLRSPHTLGGHQQLPQGEQEREFVVGALRAVRQGREECEPFGHGGDRVMMGIAPGGIGPRLLPIVHGTLDHATALEVDCQLGRDLPRPRAIPGLQADPHLMVQLPAFSAKYPPAHAYERVQKSSPGAGLRADGGD